MKACSFFSAAVFTAIISTFSCSSGDGGDTPSGGGSVSPGTDDPALYCVVEALSYCVTGLSGKQCRDDGYRGNSGYSDTKCPGGYDIITKIGSSSSFGGQGGISSNIGNAISSSSSIGVSSSSSSSIGNVISSSSSIGVSSSSIISSSSSAGVSVSSSSAGCTAENNTATQYCSNGTMKEYGFVTYEGQKYKTVVIGTQTWMAENLNYNPGTGKSACYGNQADNCTVYGRLYDWSTAMNLVSDCNSDRCLNFIQAKHRGVCPSGWHLPSRTEWTTLTNFVGSEPELKAKDGWSGCGPSGSGDYLCEDTYGFSARPGGYGLSDGRFVNAGNYGFWWSASEYNDRFAYYRYTSYHYGEGWNNYDKPSLLSVRCVQD